MRSDARKRLEEREGRDHWEHPDAETRRLIQRAKAEAWEQGYMARWSEPDVLGERTGNPYRSAS